MKEYHRSFLSAQDLILHCVSKNDTDIAHYNFNAYQPILVIFGSVVFLDTV